jgi:type III restriction enzyme
MKLKFKQQSFQTDAVKAVVDCFKGQPKSRGHKYALDPGRATTGSTVALPGMEGDGFANDKLAIPQTQLLENLQGVQRRHNLPLSPELMKTSVCDVNLDVEMETGTGKTYCYIKTMFELNRDYGWSKFIVVVPSIAIREGRCFFRR